MDELNDLINEQKKEMEQDFFQEPVYPELKAKEYKEPLPPLNRCNACKWFKVIGYSVEAIAKLFRISKRTVHAHLRRAKNLRLGK